MTRLVVCIKLVKSATPAPNTPPPMPVTVSSPSRLHFGLFSVGQMAGREFGGIGLMVQAPRTTITHEPSERFSLVDQSADATKSDRKAAARKAVQKWLHHFGDLLPQPLCSTTPIEDLPVIISILQACPRHNGLGSGTQLAITVALALEHHFGLPSAKADEMAIATERAGRSAIGTFGCFEGGFLVDRGKTPTENMAPIDLRIDFPEHWPIALVYPEQTPEMKSTTAAGLHGIEEIDAFKRISPTTKFQLKEMRSLVKNRIVPALVQESYHEFGKALQTFGRRSGDYFRSVQGGTFASSQIEEIVDLIDRSGVPAVGQTSWGPCVFAIAPNMEQLTRSTDAVSKKFGPSVKIEYTHADNRGATISKT